MFTVFLDIDGVMNVTSKINSDRKRDPSYVKKANGMIVYKQSLKTLGALRNSNSSLFVSNLQIVVHSSWRRGQNKNRPASFFNEGFGRNLVENTTPYPPHDKIKSINNFIKQNNINRYVVLDDRLALSPGTPHIRIAGNEVFGPDHGLQLSRFAKNGVEQKSGQYNLVTTNSPVTKYNQNKKSSQKYIN